VLGSTQQDVDPVLSSKETGFALLVPADKGDNNDLGLFTLEVVDGGQSEGLYQLAAMQLRAMTRLLFLLGVQVSFKQFLISVTQVNLVVFTEGGAQLLKLPGVWSQDSDVRALVHALPNNVPDQRFGH
jgi:hypothetical protein